MGRRNNNDVFVIGDELLASETTLSDSAALVENQENQAPGGHPQPSGLGSMTPPPMRRGRWAALVGLAGGAASTVAVLVSSHGGSPSRSTQGEASPRSALASRPAPRVTAPPVHVARTPPDARLSESSHRDSAASRRSQTTEHEPERESTPLQAPESSSLPVAPSPVSEAPAPAPAPTPASPPPFSYGGGPGDTEQFGFER